MQLEVSVLRHVERGGRLLRRLDEPILGLGDQALVSAVNFLTMILLARTLNQTDFGLFALMFTFVLLVGTLQSAMITQPHNVLGAAAVGPAYVRYTTSTALSQLLFTGSAMTLPAACALFAIVLGSDLATLLVALVPAIGAGQLQEFVRRVLYTENRVGSALANDLLSYGGRAALLGALFVSHSLSAPNALYAFAASSIVGSLVGGLQIRRSLSWQADTSAFVENLRFGKWLAGSEIGYWASTQVYLYLVAFLLGSAATGALKAGQLLVAPLNIPLFYLQSVLPARFTRAYDRGGVDELGADMRHVYRIAAPLLGSYCAVVSLLATPLLVIVFGDAYAGAGDVVLLLAVNGFLITTLPILSSGLRAMRTTRKIFAAYFWASVLALAFGWVFVIVGETTGAVVGMILSAVVVNAYCALAYARESRRNVPRGASAETRHQARGSAVADFADWSGWHAKGAPVPDHRPLAWSCMLPSEIRLRCVGAPESFARLCEERSDSRGWEVLVAWERRVRDLPKLESFDAVVLVNGPAASRSELRRAGFHSIREFGIVPGMRNPRWFLPLDSPQISAGALRLYAPYRPMARVQYALVRTAARARAPFWYRDRLSIAQRTSPLLEDALQRILDASFIRLGLASGSRGVLHKPALVVLDERGRAIAFAKTGISAFGVDHLRREAEALIRIAGLTERRPIAPKLIFEGYVDGTYVTVQTALEGSPGQTRLSSAHDRFLSSLLGTAKHKASSVEFFRSIIDRTRGNGDGELARAAEGLRPILDRLMVPTAIVHGDFAPWNLRSGDGEIAAFDWERASLDALPLIDLLHHKLQVGFFLQGWGREEAYRSLVETARSRPYGLEPLEVHALEAAYIVDLLLRLREEGLSGGRLGLHYRELLGRMMNLVESQAPA